MKDQIRITEIFYSLQGETRTVGWPTAFVRFTGCPLRCTYCDSAYAFHGGNLMSIDDILNQVASYQPKYVTVTGGEPLAQPLCLPLLAKLCDQGYEVSLETSGALDISKIDQRVVKVVDLKTPGSQENHRNFYENLNYLNLKDQIKFIICSRDDYDWAKRIITEYQIVNRCEILFSPSFGVISNRTLADWIVEDNLPVRFQIQLHKYVWGDIPGH